MTAKSERPRRTALLDAAVSEVARRYHPHPEDYAERLKWWRDGHMTKHSERCILAEFRRLANAPEPTP